MRRIAVVMVLIAFTPCLVTRAGADTISITSGIVGFDLDDFQPTHANISGPGASISGVLFGSEFPCLTFCDDSAIVDVSATYRIGAGEDLFDFGGQARIGDVTSPDADATLTFVSRPIQVAKFGSASFQLAVTPFTMFGHLRLFGKKDEGSIIAQTDITGRGMAHVALGAIPDNGFFLRGLAFEFERLEPTPEPTTAVLIGGTLIVAFLR
jgi:hypothetical protein